MNKKISLAATGVFAVLMGLAFMPAGIAAPMPQVEICHNDDGEDGIRGTEDDYWEQKFVNGNAVDKHIANHADASGQSDFKILSDDDGVSAALCASLVLADPNPNP
ncbi:MAG: hypothetical protein OES14_08185 [Nitrosopumilus sp.]|nr:hypothetical protein [Nitrosopumilus sp.]